jgi:hypothetical protein
MSNNVRHFPPNKFNAPKDLNLPCTLKEAVQIAHAAVQDNLKETLVPLKTVVVQQTLIIESLKTLLVSEGVATMEEIDAAYRVAAENYKKEREEFLAELQKETEVDPESETSLVTEEGLVKDPNHLKEEDQ